MLKRKFMKMIGAIISEMKHFVIRYLRKIFVKIVLQAGINDGLYTAVQEIVNSIKDLKLSIQKQTPELNVII